MSKQSRHGDMDGNAALVTVSSSGLGWAAAAALAARGGTNVVVNGRNKVPSTRRSKNSTGDTWARSSVVPAT